MFAIRDDRDFVTQDGQSFLPPASLLPPSSLSLVRNDVLTNDTDFMKGARKLQEAKKHESSSEYAAV